MILNLFQKLNQTFTTQIEIPAVRELEEDDMEKAQQFADHWATQKDRADKYTALIQQGTVDKATAEAYFIERIAPLPHQVNSIIGSAKNRALGSARKYSKMLKEVS